MPITGERPGTGTYVCAKCGQEVNLDDQSDMLPPCPKCACQEYEGEEED